MIKPRASDGDLGCLLRQCGQIDACAWISLRHDLQILVAIFVVHSVLRCGSASLIAADRRRRSPADIRYIGGFALLVATPLVRDLLFSANYLFVAAKIVWACPQITDPLG